MLPELLTKHRGRFVALDQAVVLAVGDTEIATLNLAYARKPAVLVLVRKVTDQPEPIERLPLFRPIQGASRVPITFHYVQQESPPAPYVIGQHRPIRRADGPLNAAEETNRILNHRATHAPSGNVS